MGAAYGLDSIERRGSRFWLRFPAADPAQAHVHAMAAESQARPSSTLPPLNGCCLIVEDDPVVVRAWMSLMQAWHVDARCAASATEAFALLYAGLRPQAILCDQRLRSGESGIEVLKTLLERCPGASGAMVSG